VPFPPDPLESISAGLEEATEQLFRIEPAPGKVGSPLCGGILDRQRILKGVQNHQVLTRNEIPHVCFAFPANEKDTSRQIFNARPFIHVDGMLRPHVVTRLKNRDIGRWEYTRFRAESNAVVTVDDDSAKHLSSSFPSPDAGDYTEEEAAVQASTPGPLEVSPETSEKVVAELPDASRPRKAESIGDAIAAMRSGQYDIAIEFLSKLVIERPDYHIGWLRLGHAQREKGVRIRDSQADTGASITLLTNAIKSFDKAVGHVSDNYKAQALYERSKAKYQLFRQNQDDVLKEGAKSDAVEAARLSPDTAYFSWVEYLEGK